MNDTLSVVLIVVVCLLLWDKFTKKPTNNAMVPEPEKGSLHDKIALMLEEEGF